MRLMLTACLLLAPAGSMAQGHAAPHRVEVRCHRTANEDSPENTLDSLEQAALLGCDLVEIDVRRTLDGVLILNHDGMLDRLTDGTGDVATTYFADLNARDAGSWMGERFAGLRIARLDEALRFAHERKLKLLLDIKVAGLGPEILRLLRQEDMLTRVEFGGEWADIAHLYPHAPSSDTGRIWVAPGVTRTEINRLHHAGKQVVVNFSVNLQQMNVSSMRAAVAAGADSINVDFPRLGAEAAGRPVELKVAALTLSANHGEGSLRSTAILQLARYRGFALEPAFLHWLLDADDRVSRAAAVALVTARPHTASTALIEALGSSEANARANAAWAMGNLDAPTALLLPLLQEHDPHVLTEALLALSHLQGPVDAGALMPLLAHPEPTVRGAAALALARHQPEIALKTLPAQLRKETRGMLTSYDAWVAHGRPNLTPAETTTITGYFRAEMKLLQAISSLPGPIPLAALEAQAFRPGDDDFAQSSAVVAGFMLWDRISIDPEGAVDALASTDNTIADRAEWILIQAGPAVLPAVRAALQQASPRVQARALRVVAWQRDTASLCMLRRLETTDPTLAAEAAWAIAKIESLHPLP